MGGPENYQNMAGSARGDEKMSSDNWLDELAQIREQAEEQAPPPLDTSVLKSKRDQLAEQILRNCNALSLLRQVQQALLGGQGIIDSIDHLGQHDRVITLAWQGPVSAARRPDPADPAEYNYILIGVRAGKLYVNSQEVRLTPEALKAGLVKAAKAPGHTQRQNSKSSTR
jgi:hypothetical protein